MTARKVMLLGEIGVGKSSIVRRLVLDSFDYDYKPTLGVDIYRYEVPVLSTTAAPDAEPMSLIIWDTDGNMGHAIFKHIYMKEASAALILGDVTRPDTLQTMADLATGFRDAFPGRHMGLIANKIDLLDEGQTFEPPKALADVGRAIVQTSAKTGHQVESAFLDAATAIRRREL